MTVNRFGCLLYHLHLNDNSAAPKPDDGNYDKLYKLRPFLTQIAENFKNTLYPSETMAVDESMIKFKGRSSLKQFMPKKPVKRGFKVWVLADKCGYAWKFGIYTGKKGDTVEKQLGESVVKSPVEDVEDKDHKIYFDNYFTSTGLLQHSKKRRFMLVEQ